MVNMQNSLWAPTGFCLDSTWQDFIHLEILASWVFFPEKKSSGNDAAFPHTHTPMLSLELRAEDPYFRKMSVFKFLYITVSLKVSPYLLQLFPIAQTSAQFEWTGEFFFAFSLAADSQDVCKTVLFFSLAYTYWECGCTKNFSMGSCLPETGQKRK